MTDYITQAKQVQAIANARRQLDAKRQKAEMIAELWTSKFEDFAERFKMTYGDPEAAARDAAEHEDQLRNMIEEYFHLTGDGEPCEGVKAQARIKVTYIDEDLVIKSLREKHLGTFIKKTTTEKIDKRALNKFVTGKAGEKTKENRYEIEGLEIEDQVIISFK